MPQNDPVSLWCALRMAEDLPRRFFAEPGRSLACSDLLAASYLGGRIGELRGRSVLVYTTDQLSAALVLIELDGVASRLILCPADFPLQHLPHLIDVAGVEAIVSDRSASELNAPGAVCIPLATSARPATDDRSPHCATEWVLLTSGTTGLPKLVAHKLTSLAGAIPATSARSSVVWGTFYDIRRYGGLQIFLRAVLTGASIVFSSASESIADFLECAGAHGVTHISGTPSHWRRALMTSAARKITPEYVRLSGEIADQGLLTSLQSAYPGARVAHAFASTEAGLAFEVNDGLEGFPARFIGDHEEVQMRVEDGSLRVRSPRMADRYLYPPEESIAGPDGFVDTRDMLELRGDRYYFVGRRDGVINIGGSKVHPEEVEAVINRHPMVRMSLVRARKNPITGAIVVADVVLKEPGSGDSGELRDDILLLCRRELAAHKVPAMIKFVPALTVGDAGKLLRFRA